MKKSFRNYAIIWAILLVAFNAAVFLIRPVIPYYSILNSSISEVSDGLRKFRSRVRTSLELIFSDDSRDNSAETVQDLLSSTAALYDLIAVNTINAVRAADAHADYLNKQNHNFHAFNDAYFDKCRHSMELLIFICDSIIEF